MNNHSNSDLGQPPLSAKPLEFDPAKYMPDIEGFDISEEQKNELLAALWAIMQGFVNLGFDVGKADVCGQLFDGFNVAAIGAPGDVELSLTQTMEMQADGKDGRNEG